MTTEHFTAFFKSLPFSYIVVFFGGIFTVVSIQNNAYFIESFATFLYGATLVLLDKFEAESGNTYYWSKRMLFLLWAFVFISRSVNMFQTLYLWAH